MSLGLETHVRQAAPSKFCSDCRDKLDLRHFKTEVKASDPHAYLLIHEYTYKTGVPSTGQSRDCDLCVLVIDVVAQAADTDGLSWEQQWDRKWVTGRWFVQCHSTKEELLNLKTLRIQLDDESYGSLEENFIIGREDVFLDIRANASDSAAKYISSREFDTNPSSLVNIGLANGWVDQCFRTHKACQSQFSTPLLPTRVVDIGELDCDRVRLCDTSGQRGKYVALSYCWGQNQPQRTTIDNLAANFNSIDFESLSLTIKDAVTIIRHLGIRYMWIDALCIIQDSAEDKRRELANMANIYENASVTLVAASAAGADEGFLKPKPIPKIDLRIPYGQQGTLLLRRQRQVNEIDLEPDPTESRAWCLQESLLSRRCLVYSSLYLYWACQEISYANQDIRLSTNDFLLDNIHHSVQNLPAVFRTARQGDQLYEEDWRQLRAFWRNFVSEYSYRQISFPTDRLPAISAIVKKFHDLTGDDFYAGIWKSDFAYQFLWKKSTKEVMLSNQISPVQSRPNVYIAPTWSWLSCQGRVVYLSCAICPDFKVENTSVELVNSFEPFGPIQSGSLILVGRLEEINIFDLSHAGFHWIGRKHRSLSEIYAQFGHGKGEAKGFPDAEDEMVPGMDDAWCLEVGIESATQKWLNTSRRIGLILKRVGPGDTFQRIGYFREIRSVNYWFQDSELRKIRII